jgi:ABC-type transport system involved in multi-copper enzyme maturation permease subunit
LAQHKFLGLMRWELEENLSLPLLAFLVASAIIATMVNYHFGQSYREYTRLYYSSGTVLLISSLVAGAFFARSFAGSIGRGTTKIMLSYPIKRSQLFLSKFIALFLVISVIYLPVFCVHVYVDGLAAFGPMILLSLFGLLLQLMLTCSVAVGISLLTKSEVVSILATVLLLFGLDSILGMWDPLSAQGRLFHLFQYFGNELYGTLPFGGRDAVTADATLLAVLVPVVVFVVLIVGSFVYFTRFMEVD